MTTDPEFFFSFLTAEAEAGSLRLDPVESGYRIPFADVISVRTATERRALHTCSLLVFSVRLRQEPSHVITCGIRPAQKYPPVEGIPVYDLTEKDRLTATAWREEQERLTKWYREVIYQLWQKSLAEHRVLRFGTPAFPSPPIAPASTTAAPAKDT